MDLGLVHGDLAPFGLELRGHVAIVEPRDDRAGVDGRALAEPHLEHAARDLAAEDSLLAFDEARVVRGPALAPPRDHDYRLRRARPR